MVSLGVHQPRIEVEESKLKKMSSVQNTGSERRVGMQQMTTDKCTREFRVDKGEDAKVSVRALRSVEVF